MAWAEMLVEVGELLGAIKAAKEGVEGAVDLVKDGYETVKSVYLKLFGKSLKAYVPIENSHLAFSFKWIPVKHVIDMLENMKSFNFSTRAGRDAMQATLLEMSNWSGHLSPYRKIDPVESYMSFYVPPYSYQMTNMFHAFSVPRECTAAEYKVFADEYRTAFAEMLFSIHSKQKIYTADSMAVAYGFKWEE